MGMVVYEISSAFYGNASCFCFLMSSGFAFAEAPFHIGIMTGPFLNNKISFAVLKG
jgi:hypothetical protein